MHMRARVPEDHSVRRLDFACARAGESEGQKGNACSFAAADSLGVSVCRRVSRVCACVRARSLLRALRACVLLVRACLRY